jgi:hypothetical protein
MTESSEEKVISKRARVYEEIGFDKKSTDQGETIRDQCSRKRLKTMGGRIAKTIAPSVLNSPVSKI